MAQVDDKLKLPGADLYQTGAYVERNPTYHVEDSAWKAREIIKMIERHNLRPRTVCEIGCGAGEILRQLQSSLPDEIQFSGYEISPAAFDLCRARANDRLKFYCEDLLSLDREPFDLLLCIDVFEHVPDYLGFLARLRPRATRTVFHIPLDLSAQWVFRSGPIVQAREQVGHLHYFTKETALATLRDAGYEVRDWFYTAGAIANPRSLKAKLAAWPRRALFHLHPDLLVRALGGYSLLVLAE
jgi:SAM-dependent methyltransferase